jgi:hypothetical protein
VGLYLGEDTHGELGVDVTRLDQLVKRVDESQSDAIALRRITLRHELTCWQKETT